MFPPRFIVIERVASRLAVSSKKRLLEAVGELLASGNPRLNPDAVFERLLERERYGSTGFGHGVALPHARVPELDEAVGAFARLHTPVDFDAVDDHPVDLVFGLLVPAEATDEHLQLLSRIATILGQAPLRERLRTTADANGLLTLLATWSEDEDI